jgi:Transposase DDE domain
MQPITMQSAGFLMVLTSLPSTVTAADVLTAYRLRWQIELAFKRLKSQLGLDRLPAKSRDLARSWLLAHLILALLIDDAIQEILDSPPCAARHAPTLRLAVASCPNAA